MQISDSVKKIVRKMFDFAKRHYYLLSSLLMFLSFPSYDVWLFKGFAFFAWFSLVPIFVFVKGKPFREIFFHSFIVFLIGNFLTFQWIGNFGAEVKGGYAVIVLFLIPSLTVFMATKMLLAEALSRRFELLRVIIIPSVWILIDWIQSLGFLAFPWTYWGYSQYPFTSFIQMASVTGIMGVTFVLVLMNALIAQMAEELAARKASRDLPGYIGGIIALKSVRHVGVGFLCVLAITFAGMISMWGKKAVHRDLRVAMVQTCIDPWDNWQRNRMRYLAELERETRAAASLSPNLVIWSESATLETISYDFERGFLNEFELQVLHLAEELHIPILTGEIGRLDDYIRRVSHVYNNAVLISEEGKVVKSYSKINLVPFGEWFPYERWFRWVKVIVDSFGASSFTPGSETAVFEVLGKKFGVLVCYEGIFFRHVRRYASLGIDFLVNITNDGWTDTFNGHMQHFAASVFRAIENGRWVVRAGNTGFSSVIDPHGRTVASMPILTKGYFAGDMDFRLNRETPYSRVGDAFSYAVFCFLAVLAVILLLRRTNIKLFGGGS
jgi:apolipoprotein N-acyltransferase